MATSSDGSVLTIVGGRGVYAAAELARLGPPPLPVSPDWSPVRSYGGYAHADNAQAQGSAANQRAHGHVHALGATARRWVVGQCGLWSLGCELLRVLRRAKLWLPPSLDSFLAWSSAP